MTDGAVMSSGATREYTTAVLASLDGNAAVLDPKGMVIAINEGWSRFGSENGAAQTAIGVGVNYLEVCRKAAANSRTAAAVLEGILAVKNGKTPVYRHDYKCDSPQVLRWFRVTVTPWHAQTGCLLVLHSDISEDKLPAEMHNRTLKSVRAIIWSADAPSFRTTFLSGQVEEILGFPATAWQDDPDFWKQHVHPKDRDWVFEYSHKAVEEGRDHEFDYRMLTADGRTVWLRQVVSLVSHPGQPVHLTGVSFDITELKRAEERLKILGGRILKAQDDERAHIARELHDDIGQRLAGASMDLGRLQHTETQSTHELRRAIAEIKNQISEITMDIGTLAHNLHSHTLETRGLVDSCDDFCREIAARRNMNIKFRADHMPANTPAAVNVGVFRVLQEALQNAVKHSGAKNLEVTLSGSAEAIELAVKDDGRGFDRKKAVTGKGLGLTGMEERMTLLGGEFSVSTQPAKGTTIQVRVPLNDSEASGRRRVARTRKPKQSAKNLD